MPEAHQRERGREAEHDHDHDQAEHRQAEGGVGHTRSFPMRWCAASSIASMPSIAWRFASSSTWVLAASCCSTTSVSSASFRRARPRAGLQADDAAHDLRQTLREDERPGDRDQRLEVVDGRAFGGDVRALADPPGVGGVVPAREHQCEDPGDEEEEVEREIERRLRARAHRAVEEVAADVRALREGVGAAHHEGAAVEHRRGVEHPRRRHVQDVALQHLDADQHHQQADEPGEGLAYERAELVGEEDEALHPAPAMVASRRRRDLLGESLVRTRFVGGA